MRFAGPRAGPELRDERLRLHLVRRQRHEVRDDEPVHEAVPIHRRQQRDRPHDREDLLPGQSDPERAPPGPDSEDRAGRQALVERRRQRPLDHQRADAHEHLRQDAALQPRRLGPERQSVPERTERGAVHLRLRAAQSVPLDVPAQRPADDTGHRVELLGGARHDPARRQLRLGLRRRRLRELWRHQPRLCLRPLPGRRCRVGGRGVHGLHVPQAVRQRRLRRRLQHAVDRRADVRPDVPDRVIRHRLRQRSRDDRRPRAGARREPLLREHLQRLDLQDLGAGPVRPLCLGVGDAERGAGTASGPVLVGRFHRPLRAADHLLLELRRRLGGLDGSQPVAHLRERRDVHRDAHREQRVTDRHGDHPGDSGGLAPDRDDQRAVDVQRRAGGGLQRNGNRCGRRRRAAERLLLEGRLLRQRRRAAVLLGRGGVPVLWTGDRCHLRQLPGPDGPLPDADQLLPDHADRH